jgi:hypothetical protein
LGFQVGVLRFGGCLSSVGSRARGEIDTPFLVGTQAEGTVSYM